MSILIGIRSLLRRKLGRLSCRGHWRWALIRSNLRVILLGSIVWIIDDVASLV